MPGSTAPPRIAPIPTEYNGVRLRSKLEASWAKWLDEYEICWAYEAEGFQIDDTRYLPDFWLPEIRTVIEVKGVLEASLDKTLQFAKACAGRDVPVLVGMAPPGAYLLAAHPAPATWCWLWGEDGPDGDIPYLDGGLGLLECPDCHKRYFARLEGAYLCRACGVWENPTREYSWLIEFEPDRSIFPSELEGTRAETR